MPSITTVDPISVRRRLLRWYGAKARVLPWRVEKGETPDPYRVWLSEIMLQQTTVATVSAYFGKFLGTFPTVQALAGADLDAVLHAWQGLGYYARARNLHKCACVVTSDLGGRFPETEEELKKLPGIGDYTAAAIAAIAFGRNSTPIDGNIERVTARLYAFSDPLVNVKAKMRLYELAARLTPIRRAGDFVQALMDLGATVCTPKKPDCGACPIKSACRAGTKGDAERYPVKAAKKPRPLRHGIVFWAARADGGVLLRRRPEKGLLGGMMEIPSTDWRQEKWNPAEAKSAAPVTAKWRPLDGIVRHTFTHFQLELTVLTAETDKQGPKGSFWCPPAKFSEHALPTVMKKVAKLVSDYSS